MRIRGDQKKNCRVFFLSSLAYSVEATQERNIILCTSWIINLTLTISFDQMTEF